MEFQKPSQKSRVVNGRLDRPNYHRTSGSTLCFRVRVADRETLSWSKSELIQTSLAPAIAQEFGEPEGEGESARGKAAHGHHQGEPARVGVRPLRADASEDGRGEQGRNRPDEEDGGTGAEELAGITTHRKGSRFEVRENTNPGVLSVAQQ